MLKDIKNFQTVIDKKDAEIAKITEQKTALSKSKGKGNKMVEQM